MCTGTRVANLVKQPDEVFYYKSGNGKNEMNCIRYVPDIQLVVSHVLYNNASDSSERRLVN